MSDACKQVTAQMTQQLTPMPDTAGIVTLTVRHAVGEVSTAQLVICGGNIIGG